MLNERDRELISAAIDGELSAGDSRRLQRLLADSTTARALHGRLMAHQQRVRQLPRVTAPAELAGRVAANLPAQHTVRRPALDTRPLWSGLVPWAVALSLFAAVGLTSYFSFRVGRVPPVQGVDTILARHAAPEVPAELAQPEERVVRETPPVEPDDDVVPMPKFPDTLVEGPKSAAPAIMPPAVTEPGDVLTAQPRLPLSVAQIVRPALPATLALRELEQSQGRQRLLEELRRHDCVHLDLTSREPGKDAFRLHEALKTANLKVLADPLAQERLNVRFPSEYAVFIDAITIEDLAKVLQALTVGERRPDEKLFVSPLWPTDTRDLQNLLGTDPFPGSLGRPRSPAGVDVRKPVSDGTATQVLQTLANTGDQRSALMLAYPPLKTSLVSKEMKQYLDGRKPRPAGALAVYLVIR